VSPVCSKPVWIKLGLTSTPRPFAAQRDDSRIAVAGVVGEAVYALGREGLLDTHVDVASPGRLEEHVNLTREQSCYQVRAPRPQFGHPPTQAPTSLHELI
jgi:hypothetical protein